MSARRSAPEERTPALFDLGPEAKPPLLPGREDPPALEAGTLFAQVALNRPLPRPLTYLVPPALAPGVAPGTRVAVPLGRRREIGVVVSLEETSDVPVARLRAVHKVLDATPLVGDELLGLTRWIAGRYASSWGEALAAVLPAHLKREGGSRKVSMVRANPGTGAVELGEIEERFPKQHRLLRTLLDMDGAVELREILRQLNLSESPARSLERRGWIRIERVAVRTDELGTATADRPRPERLSAAQEAAVEAIGRPLAAGEHATFLLEGVTGSGKTEVYLRAIERALALGRGAIVLVPEIALTPQTVGWFRSRFGQVAVLHSRMTDAQRLDTWLSLERGEARVVVGARSAIFAPIHGLGVIVVDEEHEPSFKQNNAPRYHARDVAVERARRAGAVCVLGSATPSLESWQRARDGELVRLSLPERVGGGSPPAVHVVDMRLERERGKGQPMFSRLLRHLLTETLEAKEQAILFLNRRGFVPVLYCPGCERTVRCTQCDVSLTLHRRITKLVCHTCCEELPIPPACPACSRPGLRHLGFGAERVEAGLAQLFPSARVRRMDSDTMRRREDYERVLDAFGRGEVDVLVGTQMIAKGLDFPRVTLVGIVMADTALHLPDLRATERTFQLIAQVAGRAGRSELPGRIVVQTLDPTNAAVRLASRNDFEGFARLEAADRLKGGYPPFGRLLRLVVEDTDEARVKSRAAELATQLARTLDPARIWVSPTSPAPLSVLRGRHRWQIVLKGPANTEFERAVALSAKLAAAHSRPRVIVDVDPVSLL